MRGRPPRKGHPGTTRTKWRSPYDRDILRLAFPALGALASEPLYVLVDTAIVGHLGRPQLAALGIAGALLSGLYGLFNFLAYATTAHVARYDGAGQRRLADSVAAQSLWLSLAIGAVLLALTATLAHPAVAAMGGEGRTASYAVTYLRIAAIGLPFALVALAGQGYLRGISNLRTPLVIVVGGNVANLVLEVLFVYGFHWGIRGSAWGTAIAQAGMGAAFIAELLRASHERRLHWGRLRALLRIGRHILVRTTALITSFVFAGAIITRFGDASIGAHQIAFQLWAFLALVLDAVAIAGQVMVGRALGAGDDDGAYDAAARMIVLSVVVGAAATVLLFAVEPLLPLVFTSDSAVLERVHAIWPLFALMQPLNGAVFALDGILIGAGDSRFLMRAMLGAGAVFCALALLAYALDLGAVGVWGALFVLILTRLASLGVRFTRRRWAVTGWA